MAFRHLSSRLRYRQYRRELRQRRAGNNSQAGGSYHGHHAPRDRGPRHRSFFELLRSFLGLLRSYRLALSISLVTLSLATLLKLVPPAATKVTIDYVLGEQSLQSIAPAWLHVPASKRDQLLLIAAAVVAISALETTVRLWGRWYATRTTKRVQTSVQRRVFAHAVRLPLHRVYELKSGGVASILREDAGGVGELVFSMLYNPWRAVVQLVGSLLVLAWVDWRLLIGSLLLLPMVFFTHRTWISRIRPVYRDIRRQRQDVDGHATEAFGGMRVVRAFTRQRSETGRFAHGIHLMARKELLAWWWARLVELVWEILLPVASVGLLLYGGLQVLSGQLTLGDLMMFLAYLAMLLGPLAVLANSATQFQNNLAGLDRVLDLLAEDHEMPDRPGALRLRPEEVAGRITLENVSFRYPGREELVLRDINLEVEPGQLIALVGHSGAGKTTLTNLIARFFDPTSGTIRLDGVDLRDIELDSYRSLLGIVEQDIFLFDGTVADNIGYASRNTTPDDIRRAAVVANADEFILGFPDGFDTIIGERGVRLSGGQRQRIAIARAILADPRILILDEATSNLDTASERLIQQSLRTLMQGRTSFVIAHRLSTIHHADRIVVLEHGRIVETGTHEELMQDGSHYRRTVQLQADSALLR